MQFVGQFGEQIEDQVGVVDVERSRWLVSNDDVRAMGERGGERDPLRLAGRDRAERPVAEVGDTKPGQHRAGESMRF